MTLTANIAVNVTREGFAVRSSDVDGIARRQDGVVTRAQLLRIAEPHAVDNAVKSKRLFVIYRSVYAVGSDRLSDRGRARAAVLATAPYSAASWGTAVALHRLTPSMPAVLHVSLTRGQRRSRDGIIVHRGLEPSEVTYVSGIPVTTPLQTLEDMGFPDRLVREALARNLVRPEQLPFERPVDNDFEDRMRALVRRAGLPEPVAQYRIGPYRVDFAWRS